MKRILLIRHGESEGNIDPTLCGRVADNSINLSRKGVAQAVHASVALSDYMNQEGVKWRVWNSPYSRARQTADTLVLGLNPNHIIDRRENLLLVEQQFGALNGIASESTRDHLPHIADE